MKARFWRLYCHDENGAGIIVGNEKHELFPKHIYLIPPGTDFGSWNTRPVVQLGINFTFGILCGKAPFYELPMTEETERLYREIQNLENELSATLFRLYCTALCSLCMTQIPKAELWFRREESLHLALIDGWIRDFYQEPVSVSRLAASVGMNRKTLNKHFYAQLKTTPYQYLLSKRYEYAARLLEKTNYSIKEICQMISINDPFHFSRTFRRRYGLSPSAWRKAAEEKRS